jgi:hypothetical protein
MGFGNQKLPFERERQERRRRLVWASAIVFSIALHCLLAILATPRGGVEKSEEGPEKIFEVALLPAGKATVPEVEKKEPSSVDSGEERAAPPVKQSLAKKAQSVKPMPGKGRAAGDALLPEPPPVTETRTGAGIEIPQAQGKGTAAKVDIWPSSDSLARIAGADPRVPHIIAEKEPPLVPERYVKDNLPPQLKPREIELKLDGFWNPTWEQVRDEGVTGYSTRKFGGMLKDWLTSWQTAVARAGEGGYDPSRLEGLETSSTIVTLVEFLPGQDGNWNARLLNRSGYRTYDSKILEDAERVALTLPRWDEGSGWALRFRFETKFMIVPPAPMLALSFDYVPPFNPEIIYPLKKMLKKAITFEGATRLQGTKYP